MTSPETVLPVSCADKIASYQLLPPNGLAGESAQAAHRINLVNTWGLGVIGPGSRVLEIGCGQGNCTAVLAEAVGPTGHVDAYDPAPPDYGAPFTLEQAQRHISESDIGGRVTWHRGNPCKSAAALASGGISGAATRVWDVVVLSHCVWYFGGRDELSDMLGDLLARVKEGGKVCIAEYALRATEREAWPHVLAALARGTLETLKKEESRENIKMPLSPPQIKAIAAGRGWSLDAEALLVPNAGVLDGRWETSTVAHDDFSLEVKRHLNAEDWKTEAMLESMRASVLASVDAIGGLNRTRTMDVWTGMFSVEQQQAHE